MLKSILAIAPCLLISASIAAPIDTTIENTPPTAPPEPEVVIEMVNRWVLPNSTRTEEVVLNALQDRGIMGKNAIATVMGNIKQESRFNSNICEGGARIGYWSCRSGGYGLIQWTTQGRYDGLGRHARRVGHDPSTVDAQVSYLFTESQWKNIETYFKKDGYSIGYYMGKAYYWLGWGHHGHRTNYAYDYASRIIEVQVPK